MVFVRTVPQNGSHSFTLTIEDLRKQNPLAELASLIALTSLSIETIPSIYLVVLSLKTGNQLFSLTYHEINSEN